MYLCHQIVQDQIIKPSRVLGRAYSYQSLVVEQQYLFININMQLPELLRAGIL